MCWKQLKAVHILQPSNVDCTLFLNISFSLLPEKKRKKKTQILEPENNPISLLHSPVSQAQGFIGVLSVMGFGHVSADEMR